MLEVDMQAALSKKAESLAADLRTQLREKNLRHAGLTRNGQNVDVLFQDETPCWPLNASFKTRGPNWTANAALKAMCSNWR